MTEYYSLEDVARRLGKSEDQVHEMVSNGELRAFRDAGSFKFRKADIDSLAPGAAPPPDEGDIGVQPEAETEPERDELLFLIDEEAAGADPDDLTLIGESDEAAVLGPEGPEGMFAEEIGLTAGQDVDDEALTAVMETADVAAPGVGVEEPTVDLFAEVQEDMAAGEAEADAAAIPGTAVSLGRAARMRQLQEAAQYRSPVMSVLLVLAFLALLWTGIVVYNSFIVGAKPIANWLGWG